MLLLMGFIQSLGPYLGYDLFKYYTYRTYKCLCFILITLR